MSNENMLNAWSEAAQESATITTEQLDKFGHEYIEAWDKYEAAKEEAARLFRLFEEKEKQMHEGLALSGKTKYPVEGVGTFSMDQRLSVQTPKTEEDKKALGKYLQEQGLFWKLMGVNSQSLQSFYKAQFEEHERKCALSGESTPFSIPGLQPPTSTPKIKHTSERKK